MEPFTFPLFFSGSLGDLSAAEISCFSLHAEHRSPPVQVFDAVSIFSSFPFFWQFNSPVPNPPRKPGVCYDSFSDVFPLSRSSPLSPVDAADSPESFPPLSLASTGWRRRCACYLSVPSSQFQVPHLHAAADRPRLSERANDLLLFRNFSLGQA